MPAFTSGFLVVFSLFTLDFQALAKVFNIDLQVLLITSYDKVPKVFLKCF